MLRTAAAIGLIVLTGTGAWATTPPPDSAAAKQEAQRLAQLPPVPQVGGHLDHSGRKQAGRATYYGVRAANRRMADGNRFDPNALNAASKTLPLGTIAKVTNLQNGRSATVKVQDRGPLVPGRIVDVSPRVADQLGMRQRGVTPVVVAPIAVPQPDGVVKLGAGAAESSPAEIARATQETVAALR